MASLLVINAALVWRRTRHSAANAAELERITRAFGLAQGMLRDMDGRITVWTDGAQRLYGYHAEEALGRVSHELLRTTFPRPLAEIEAELRRTGRWQGELTHCRKDGAEVTVASYWALHPGMSGEEDTIIEVNNDVTAIKRAETMARASESRLRATLESTTDSVFTLSPDWRFAFLNHQAAAQIAGGRNMLGQVIWDVFPEVGDTVFAQVYRRCMAERVPTEAEQVYAPTGARFAVRAFPAEDGGITVFFRDVTQEHAAKAALAERDARLRDLLATLDLATLLTRDLDGRIRFWSEGCVRLYGWTAAEAVGRDAHELLRTVFPVPRAEVEAALERDGKWTGDLRHRARNGREVVVAAHKVLRRDAKGRPAAVLESLTDVTDARRSEQERQRADALLRTVVEAAPVLIYAKDRQGRMTLANRPVLELIGKPWSKVEGHTDQEFLDDPAQAEAVAANDRRVIEQGRAEELEERVGGEGGHARVWLSTKTPLRDAGGAVVGLVGVSMEITERKRAEERLRLVLHELNHRVKNTLATVQAIASRTLRGADPAVRQALEARLMALAAAHDVLTRESWEGAELDDVMAGALAPHGGREGTRFRLSGPPLRLRPGAALALALGLHELATNAAKFGALSGVKTGHVAIRWETVQGTGPRFRLVWSERGGPPVAPPTRRGFGTRLVERSLAQDLGGTAKITFDRDGLTCTIDAPLDQVAAPAALLSFPHVGGVRGSQQWS